MHSFLYGIVGKLWRSMVFDGSPPNPLVAEYVEWHIDNEAETELPSDRANEIRRIVSSGRYIDFKAYKARINRERADLGIAPLRPGELGPWFRTAQQILRKHPDSRRFHGHPLPTPDTELGF